jgi:hypothetical protein
MSEEKIIVDETKMPENLKTDIVGKAVWIQEEKNRIIKERSNAEPPEVKTEVKTEVKPEVKEENKEGIKLADIGEYNSVDEIKEALKDKDLTKKERDDLKAELEEAKAKLAEKPKNTFIDKDLYRLNHIKSNKPDDFEVYKSLLYGNNNPLDILRTKFLKDNPEYKGKEDKVDLLLKDKYNLNDKYDLEDPEEVSKKELNEMKLDIDSKTARKDLLKEFESIEVPETEVVDKEKQQKEYAEKLTKIKQESKKVWQPIATEIVKSFDSLPIMSKGEKDEEEKEFMSYKPSEEEKKTLATKVLDYLVEGGKPPTEDSVREAQAYVRAVFLMENWSKIVNQVASNARSMEDEKWNKEFNNPSALNNKAEAKNKVDSVKSHNEAERKKVMDYYKNNT